MCSFSFSGGNFDKENKTPDKNYISKREFSFTLEDDIYLRYMSFSSADDLKDAMVKRIPHKIDIGAVFNAKPSDHKKIANFQVLYLTYLPSYLVLSFILVGSFLTFALRH